MDPKTLQDAKTSIPVNFLVPVFLVLIVGLPMAMATWPLFFLTSDAARMLWLVVSPIVACLAFVGTCAVLSLPFQKAIIGGKFPRRNDHLIYGPRRLYGLCWCALFYCTPIYYGVLSVPWLRKFTLWAFGYRGHPDANIAPDAWIRDLPLLKFSSGVYVANKSTVGTNMCMSDGNIVVGPVTLGPKVMIGHLTAIAPGSSYGESAEISVGCAVGIRASLGPKVRVGPLSLVNHGAQLGANVDIGASAYVGVKARIAEGLKIPGGACIPEGADLRTQEDVRSYLSAETRSLEGEREKLQWLYSQRMQSGPEKGPGLTTARAMEDVKKVTG